MQYIKVSEQFPFSVEKLFGYMEVHENLETLFFPLNVETIQSGSPQRYGVGSVRKLSIKSVAPFEETITAYKENELIEYKITKGSPLKNHHGVMKFSSTPNGSKLDYTIQFDSDVPFLAAGIKIGLENGVKSGLEKLKGKTF